MKAKLIMSEDLTTFLKSKRALKKFRNNASSLNSFEDKVVKVDFFNSFTWRCTPEGWAYWAKLYHEYGSI